MNGWWMNEYDWIETRATGIKLFWVNLHVERKIEAELKNNRLYMKKNEWVERKEKPQKIMAGIDEILETKNKRQ